MKADDRIAQGGTLLRLLQYGPAKTRKTWWALKAAESHFNVILLDGDDGWHIVNKIKPEFQNRIQILDVTDTAKTAVFCVAVTRLLKDGVLYWDEKNKCSNKLSPKPDTIVLNLDELTHHDLLVIDSWSALVWSLLFRYANENSIDLADSEKKEWGFYGWGGNLATFFLQQLKTLKCHVTLIGHSTVYEKRAPTKGKKLGDVEWQKQQLVSTSGPHAMTIAAKFSDILTFAVKGTAVKIDSTGDYDRDGGCRNVPPGTYNWDELQFVDVCKMANVALPTKDNRQIDYSLKPKPVAAKPAIHTATKLNMPNKDSNPATKQEGVVKTQSAKLSIRKT